MRQISSTGAFWSHGIKAVLDEVPGNADDVRDRCATFLAFPVSPARTVRIPPQGNAFPRNVNRNHFGILTGKNTVNEEGRMENAEGKMEDDAAVEVGRYEPVTRSILRQFLP
jgi:hypothetical protein